MKTLTPEEFIISRNFTSSLTKKEQKTYFDSMISHSGYIKAMEEYADYVLSIAAEKAETTIEETAEDPYDHYIIVDKQSILNCLKD